MSLRFGNLYEDGRYHVFNRATEGRAIFLDWRDLERFCDLLELVATEERIVSVQAIKRGDFGGKREEINRAQRLVTIEAFAILPNHFHLLVKQEVEDGLGRFMQKLCAGYSRYFNKRYDRAGGLFMGRYKYIEIKNDDDYLRVGAYVARNHEVHDFTDTVSPRRTNSSHKAMLGKVTYSFCDHRYLLESYGNSKDYVQISNGIIKDTLRRRGKCSKEDGELFLED